MAQTKVKLISDGVIDVGHLASGHGITTDNIGEGSNLYYTDARVSTYLSANSYATEGYVTTAVANLVDSAPTTLDTLNELAAALGDDPNFATTVTNSIATKLPLAGGTLTGDLGIGISPSAKLHLYTSADSDTAIRIQNSPSVLYIGVDNTTGSRFVGSSGSAVYIGTTTSSPIQFATANTVRATIDSSGNVGIGTSSPQTSLHNIGGFYTQGRGSAPTGKGLEIFYYAPADASYIESYDYASSIYKPIYYSASNHGFVGGSVGIGTTSPQVTLDVRGQIRSYASSGQIYSYSTVAANDAIVFAGWQAGTGIQMKYNPNTAIGYIENNYPSAQGVVYGDIQFRQNVSGTMTPRMIIKAENGNVGINTTSPSEKIDVAGTIRSNAYEGKVKINSTAANGKQYEFISIDTGNLGLYDGTAYRLWVAGNGNIGIGTTSPSHGLHVYHPTTNVQATFESGDTTVWINLKDNTSGTYGALLGAEGSDFIIAPNNNRAAVFKGNGNVGIGTTSPASIFHLKQDAPVLTSESTNTVSGFRINVLGGGSQLLRVQNAGTTKFQIDPNGGIYLGGSTAAANALDDYEEGTWTPTIIRHNGTVAASYTALSSYFTYVKIGRLVYIKGFVNSLTDGSSNGSNYWTIKGLPFTGTQYAGMLLGYKDLPADGIYIGDAGGQIIFTSGAAPYSGAWGSGREFMLAFVYETNS